MSVCNPPFQTDFIRGDTVSQRLEGYQQLVKEMSGSVHRFLHDTVEVEQNILARRHGECWFRPDVLPLTEKESEAIRGCGRVQTDGEMLGLFWDIYDEVLEIAYVFGLSRRTPVFKVHPVLAAMSYILPNNGYQPHILDVLKFYPFVAVNLDLVFGQEEDARVQLRPSKLRSFRPITHLWTSEEEQDEQVESDDEDGLALREGSSNLFILLDSDRVNW